MPTDFPDIVVRDPEGGDAVLFVEVKWREDSTDDDVLQLKKYMLNSRCPVGLLVDQNAIKVLRDSFRDFGSDSIDVVGNFPTKFVIGEYEAADAAGLEQKILQWLDRIALTWHTNLPVNDEAAIQVIENIVPAVARGIVSGSVE